MPFSVEQFLQVFSDYNRSVYPAQILLFIAALGSVAVVFCRIGHGDGLLAVFLASLWVWMAIAYHYVFFSAINPAAYLFVPLFTLQAALFVYAGLIRKSLKFKVGYDARSITGAVLIAFSLIFYPLIGYLIGHRYPVNPTFGTPCPTTIFTLGFLLWAGPRVPFYLLPIPLIWSVIGFTASFLLEIREDVALLVAGVVSAGLLLLGHRIGLREHRVA